MSVNGLVEALAAQAQGLGLGPAQAQARLGASGWGDARSQHQHLRGPGSGSAGMLLEDGQMLLQYLGDVGGGDASAAGGGGQGAADDTTTLVPGLAGLYASEPPPGSRPPSELAGLDGYGHHQQQQHQHSQQQHHHHQHQQQASAASAGPSGPEQGGGPSSQPQPEHAAAGGGGNFIHSSLMLPNSILVTAGTEPMQAAGLINFTFSQSPHSFFVLNTLSGAEPEQGVTSVGVLNAALRVVLSARKINQQAVARFDLGFVPFVVSDAADGIGLLVYKCSISPEVAKARGQVLKMEATSNPLVAGLSLFNMLQSSSQQLEVIFTADAAKVALQALAIMRINLANNGRDVLLLASTIEYAADASGPKNYYLLKLTPTTPTLPCFQHQIDAPKGAAAPAAVYVGDHAAPGRLQHHAAATTFMGSADQGLHGGGGAASYMQQSPHAKQLAQQQHAAMLGLHAHSGGHHQQQLLHAAMGGMPGGAGQLHPGKGPAAGGAYGSGGGLLAPPGPGSGGGQLQHKLAAQRGLGGGLQAPPGMGSGPAQQQQQLHKQARARKADYVIVTEDTAIKNAAGAVAKVLGRVSNQGQCCPVYTEKKTDSFTAVISVAVKAIAVARGYVCNEGMGNEVGFQPYLRHLDRRLDLELLHQWLSERKGGAGPGAMPGRPLMPGGGGGGGPKGLDGLDLLDEEAMHDERCELAFDVFKVPQLAELQDVGNLPVKVTAHSRPHVVSNIISKLVSEREGAVLITAGGKAMHVAMAAIVSARARLKARGIDIILLPKFVTVDTTSTLGWESVFLRFTIVRWAQALLPNTAPVGAEHAMAMGPLVQDAMGGRYMMGGPQMG